jgi:hypothetical protein
MRSRGAQIKMGEAPRKIKAHTESPLSIASRITVYVFTASSSTYPTNLRRPTRRHSDVSRSAEWLESSSPMAKRRVHKVGQEEKIHDQALQRNQQPADFTE